MIDPGGHTAIINHIIFTRDGKHLVSAGEVRLQPGVNMLAVIAANERAVSEPEVKKITYTGRGAATAKPNLVLPKR